jgi:hypothetical protein
MHEALIQMSPKGDTTIPFKNYILEERVDDFVQKKTGVSISSNPISPTHIRSRSPVGANEEL